MLAKLKFKTGDFMQIAYVVAETRLVQPSSFVWISRKLEFKLSNIVLALQHLDCQFNPQHNNAGP